MLNKWLTRCLMVPVLAAYSALAWAQDVTPEAAQAKWNMPVGVTEISREVHGLHMLIFWVCVVIAVVVFGAMFYSVFAHRRSKHPKPADFHESTTVEIIWTAVPFLILIGMAIPAAGTLIKMEDTSGSDITIKATGIQWKWHYEYVGEDVDFYSSLDEASNRARQVGSGIDPSSVPNYLLEVDNRVIVPVDKKVRVLLTAADVIHAWWVPGLAVKKDAVPGYINEIWFKAEELGVYRGQCAELCGRDHGFMPVVVEVVSQAKYDAWLSAQQGGDSAAMEVADAGTTMSDAAPVTMSKAELVKAGEKAYLTHCAACHQANGSGLPPTFPALAGSAALTGDPATPIMQALKGKNAMPSLAYLSDADIASALSYSRNSWGNSASAVQAADVAAAR